jgi:signal recognition particle subunit SEC65
MEKPKYTDFMDALDEYGVSCMEFATTENPTEDDRDKLRLAKLKCLTIVHKLLKE